MGTLTRFFGYVGDKVSIDDGTMTGVIHDNRLSKDNKISITLSNNGTYIMHIDRIAITDLKNVKKMEKKKMKDREWEFRSVVKEDIDYNLLLQDITKKNPIMLITAGNEKIVGIHHSLIHKTEVCNIQMPKYKDNSENFVLVEEDFSVWIDWAKRVKKAKWPAEMVNKRKVKVVLPTI